MIEIKINKSLSSNTIEIDVAKYLLAAVVISRYIDYSKITLADVNNILNPRYCEDEIIEAAQEILKSTNFDLMPVTSYTYLEYYSNGKIDHDCRNLWFLSLFTRYHFYHPRDVAKMILNRDSDLLIELTKV